MLCLAIESSCDDTSSAVVHFNKKIISNIINTQTQHKKFSGIVPELAARAHLSNIEHTTKQAIKDIDISSISIIAATCGPGLIGGVCVGANFAKTLAILLDKPFIAVNHIRAHALSPRLFNEIKYPYLLLLISGGHTEICVVYSYESFSVLGKTLDDSVGDCFDKVANYLQIQYPGGPNIEKYAKDGDIKKYKLPIPMINSKDCNFSFSGLKTATKLKFENELNKIHQSFSDQLKKDICASFQFTIATSIEKKINHAIEICKQKSINISAIVMAGGVSANNYIREHIKEKCAIQNNLEFFVPPISICTDNAAMIAWNAIEIFNNNLEKYNKNKFIDINFKPRPSWPL